MSSESGKKPDTRLGNPEIMTTSLGSPAPDLVRAIESAEAVEQLARRFSSGATTAINVDTPPVPARLNDLRLMQTHEVYGEIQDTIQKGIIPGLIACFPNGDAFTQDGFVERLAVPIRATMMGQHVDIEMERVFSPGQYGNPVCLKLRLDEQGIQLKPGHVARFLAFETLTTKRQPGIRARFRESETGQMLLHVEVPVSMVNENKVPVQDASRMKIVLSFLRELNKSLTYTG